jgi:prepilin-type N-terminal cleavage/methylation domain-containing protein
MPKQSVPPIKKGFSLIELIIVIAILAILLIIGFMLWRSQFDKAKDASRKADLQRLSIAFEDYYNDNNCYPPVNVLDVCGSDELAPYLDSVPCDPITQTPYCYITDDINPECFQSYRLLSSLDYTDDPIIALLKCHGQEHCGYEYICATDEQSEYNYGVSSNNIPVLNPSVTPAPIATPSPDASPTGTPDASPLPSPSPGIYACDPTGICNFYEDPGAHNCPTTFDDPDVCQDACDISSANWCES